MGIYNHLKNIGKKALLTSLGLIILGCSSTNYFNKKEDLLDNLVKIELDYQKRNKHKVSYNEPNPYRLIRGEGFEEVIETVNSIKTKTYNEFIEDLSKLNENQTITVLSSLAELAGQNLWREDKFHHVNSEEVYNLIKEYLNGFPQSKNIMCGHIHNFVSETAKKAGFPEAVTLSCETKEGKHVVSTVWLSDGNTKLIDYGSVYEGDSDLDLLLREYQKMEGIPAFTHNVYRENQIFTFTTIDGKVFYKAIDHPYDTTRLKEIIMGRDSKKNSLEIKLGNTENSVSYHKDELFGKIGYLIGPVGFSWEAPIIQIGFKNDKNKKTIKIYDINLLASPIETQPIFGICGKFVYGKRLDITPFNKLAIVGQLTSLIDFSLFSRKTTLLSERDVLSTEMGSCYTHNFNEKIKTDIYTLIRVNPSHDNVLTYEIKPVISEVRTGSKLTSGNIFINPEYIHRQESDTASLEIGYTNENLDLGFKLSNLNSLYKYIWPDEKSLEFSVEYNPLKDLSIKGSIEYSQKKWPLDERYGFGVNFCITKSF